MLRSRSAGFCRPAESHDSSQDISEEELEEIWDELPKKNAAHLVGGPGFVANVTATDSEPMHDGL